MKSVIDERNFGGMSAKNAIDTFPHKHLQTCVYILKKNGKSWLNNNISVPSLYLSHLFVPYAKFFSYWAIRKITFISSFCGQHMWILHVGNYSVPEYKYPKLELRLLWLRIMQKYPYITTIRKKKNMVRVNWNSTDIKYMNFFG